MSRGAPRALPRAFFEREVLDVARDLVGALLVRRAGRALRVARLVELEAYGGEGVDPSAHSFRGCTPRCRVMFGPAGHAYVYTTHQGRCCLNVSAVGDRSGQAVLLRAAEPLSGADAMRGARLAGLAHGPTRVRLLAGGREHELLSGPARLCAGLGVDRALDGVDLCDSAGPLWLAQGERAARVLWTPRVGLNPKSASFGWRWRAIEADSRALSGRRGGGLRRPAPARRPRPQVAR
ncbi:MAG TPA: DNA-3-methyladenine glycosylase [Planctomycetota bacterium]|nr:DNA-3-methyladenine glycosylase [Planctomycetota bacterium]